MTIRLPPLIEHQPYMFWISPDKILPMLDVPGVTAEFGHFFQDVRHFKIIHPKPNQPLPKYFLKIPDVALPQEVLVARVLINLPSAQDVFRQFGSVGTRMPTYALVVRKHNKTVRGFLVTTVFHKVLPGQNVPIGIPGFVGRPCTDLNLKAGIVSMNTEEIVNCGLSVIFPLPALLHIDVIHQVE